MTSVNSVQEAVLLCLLEMTIEQLGIEREVTRLKSRKLPEDGEPLRVLTDAGECVGSLRIRRGSVTFRFCAASDIDELSFVSACKDHGLPVTRRPGNGRTMCHAEFPVSVFAEAVCMLMRLTHGLQSAEIREMR